MCSRILLPFLAVSFLSPIVCLAGYSVEQIRALSDGDKIALVGAALDEHQSRFREFRYKAEEDEGNITVATGARQVFSKTTMELKRKGNQIWVESVWRSSEGQINQSGIACTDGNLTRSLVRPRTEGAPDRGLIDDSPIGPVSYAVCNQMLNFTPIDASGTITQWFHSLVARSQPLEISIVDKEGGHFIRLKHQIGVPSGISRYYTRFGTANG